MRASREQPSVHARDVDLAPLAAHSMHALVEGRIAPLQRVHRHRTGDQGGRQHVLGAEQARQGERGRHLRSVDERETLLRPELRRRESGDLQSFRRRQFLAAHAHLADSDQHRGEVCERREIPGGADRPLRRNHRVHLVLEQREQGVDQSLGYSGMPARQSVDLERQHEPHHRIRQRSADARGVRQQQIALQLLELIVRDARLREQTEAGVDAVGRCAGRHDPLDETARGRDARAILRTEPDGRRALVDPPQYGQGERACADVDDLAHLLDAFWSESIIGRSSPCSRAQSTAI